MIKTKHTLILIAFICLSFIEINAKTPPPTWTVNPHSFTYNMTVKGVINLDYIESTDANDIVGAFIGDECRGVKKVVYDDIAKRYIAYLMIYSNSSTGTVNFKVYDASEDKVVDIPASLEFVMDGSVGTVGAPYMWSNPTLSSESELLTFSFSGQLGETSFDATNINLTMPFGTDLTNLVANYTTSSHATVKIGADVQTSGVSANDFSSPVSYWVQSADETTEHTYIVNVKIANDIPSDIYLSALSFNESTISGSTIAKLSVKDGDTEDVHTYSLVSGDGDTDNASFIISDSLLILNAKSDYETQKSYDIRIKVDDNNGGTFEKKFTISVIDENDETPIFEAAEISIPENEELHEIYTVVAVDKDVSPEFKVVKYKIIKGNTKNTFDIDSLTGVISLVKALDFETIDMYKLKIRVADGVNTYLDTIIVNINDINDEIPVINDTNFVLSEFIMKDTIIGQLKASDKDANSILSFEIISGNTDNTFSLTSDGELSVVEYLDYEKLSLYELKVQVSDGINTADATVTIKITNEPEVGFVASEFISPNGDGINDYWVIQKAHVYRDYQFCIYDNIGQKVYESTGYNNDWDGKYNGMELPIGVYYYYVASEDCADCKFVGTISIVK